MCVGDYVVSIRIEARGLCGRLTAESDDVVLPDVSIRIEARGLCGRSNVAKSAASATSAFLFALRREVSADNTVVNDLVPQGEDCFYSH